jgi:hypothetical protein
MPPLVLDSGGVTFLARRDRATAARLLELRRRGLWPALVPTVVMVECLTGSPQRDVNVNRFLKTCELLSEIDEPTARRAGLLRTLARAGSAVDALVVTCAEPSGTVITGDGDDLRALAAGTRGVRVEVV